MDYDTAVSVMFRVMPEDAPPPPTTLAAGRARRLRDAIEPLATHSVWARGPNEALAKLGLNFLTAYVWGRAAVLGEPPAAVVASAFGVFEPNLVAALYEMGRQACGRAEMLAVRSEATIASLSAVLEGADVGPAAGALRRAVEAADGTGRVLFSGLRSLEWADDPVGQLWRACEALREHRGESHLAASVASGLDAAEMNVLSELWLGMPIGSHATTFGWPQDAVEGAASRLQGRGFLDGGQLTAAGRRFRDDIEARTDAQEQAAVDALGDDFDATVAAVDVWSAACVTAGAYPPDPYKRAGG
ncbi:MAG: SCO6745 family protein [Acidimicrobiia bacterium]